MTERTVKERPVLTVNQWLASVPAERKDAINAVRDADRAGTWRHTPRAAPQWRDPEVINMGARFKKHRYWFVAIAQSVLMGIKALKLGLTKCIVDDFKGFDPSRPDPIETFRLPKSSLVTNVPLTR